MTRASRGGLGDAVEVGEPEPVEDLPGFDAGKRVVLGGGSVLAVEPAGEGLQAAEVPGDGRVSGQIPGQRAGPAAGDGLDAVDGAEQPAGDGAPGVGVPTEVDDGAQRRLDGAEAAQRPDRGRQRGPDRAAAFGGLVRCPVRMQVALPCGAQRGGHVVERAGQVGQRVLAANGGGEEPVVDGAAFPGGRVGVGERGDAAGRVGGCRGVGVGVEERGGGGPHQRTVAGGRCLLLEVDEVGRLLPGSARSPGPAGSSRRRRAARRAASR